VGTARPGAAVDAAGPAPPTRQHDDSKESAEMVFKKLLGALGVGGPSVDTVLDGGAVQPGSPLSGRILMRGGTMNVDIERVTLDLVARVEVESDDAEYDATMAFSQQTVSGAFHLPQEQEYSLPFSIPVPWETPITEVYGQALGIPLGVRTELAVAGAVDKGDMDPLTVRPLPVQEAVLEALGQLGFGFRSADLERGRVRGTGQTLPFYQEIELSPSPQFAGAMRQVEVTFIASPNGLEVVLEADKRGGLFTEGRDVVNRFTVSHQDTTRLDWKSVVSSWVEQLARGR
jgi:sporulation-control protein